MATEPNAIVVRSPEGRSYRQGPALFKVSGDQTDGRFDFLVMEIGYLTGPGLHTHVAQDDTFYVLEGVLAVQCGDDVFDLNPGDFATVPPGLPHTFDNIRADQPPVKVINLMTPGGYEGYFAANENEAATTDPVLKQRTEEKFDVTYVGPPLAETLGLR
jgi:mannose-6-phosphate isomerase-like protein (cupin superfamily)